MKKIINLLLFLLPAFCCFKGNNIYPFDEIHKKEQTSNKKISHQ